MKMKTHGNSGYPEVFKKADLLKVLPDVMVKELKESTNIDFEKDSYPKIRNADRTIMHNHMNAATRLDVDTHIMSIEKETSYGESDEYEKKSMQDHDSEQHGNIGTSSERGRQAKGKSMEKVKFDGGCGH